MKKKISIKVPESLDEVGVKQFQELMKVDASDSDSITKSIDMISLITGLTVDKINLLDDHSLVKIGEHIAQLLAEDGKLSILPDFNGNKPIDLNAMTIGQWIDIYMLLEKKIENAQFILTQYYYQGKYTGTDYNYSARFDNYPISSYNAVYTKIVNFYSEITKEYSNIFKSEVTEKTVLTNQGAFQKKWGWYVMFHNLAQGNILNIEAVTNLPFREALTFQSYMDDYAKINN